MGIRLQRLVFYIPLLILCLAICPLETAAAEPPKQDTLGTEELDVLIPDALKGDKVGIFAPANPVTPELIDQAVDFLEQRGFVVVVADDMGIGTDDLTGQLRANAFNNLVKDAEIKAIFCLRGGYGSMHLLDKIDYATFRKNKPIFVGYSDVTAMHIAIFQQAGVVTFHGPMLVSNADQDKAFEVLFEQLMNPQEETVLKNIDETEFLVFHEGTAEGEVVGGNMVLISSLMGTDDEIDLKDKILFIEEIGEAPYKLHIILWQLKLAGKLEDLSGIMIGDIYQCDDEEVNSGLGAIFRVFRTLHIPIVYHVHAGHAPDPLTIPLGARVKIEGNKIIVKQKVVNGLISPADCQEKDK